MRPSSWLLRLSLLAILLTMAPRPAPASAPMEVECAANAVRLSSSPSERRAAALRLSRSGEEGERILLTFAADPRAPVRQAVATALAQMEGEAVMRTLASLAYDPDPLVATAAVGGLARPVFPDSVPDLRAALRSWSGARPEIAPLLLEALANRGDARDRDLALGLLSADDPIAVGAIRLLARHGREQDLDVLGPIMVGARERPAREAVAAVDALLGHPGFEALLDRLGDPRPEMKDFALVAIRRFAADEPFAREQAVRRYYRLRALAWPLLEGDGPAYLKIDALRTFHRFLANDFGFYEDLSDLPRIAARVALEPDAQVRRTLLQLLANASTRDIVIVPTSTREELPPESRRLVHYDSDAVSIPALIAALDDPAPSNRAFADETLTALSGRSFDFPFDGEGTPAERERARTRWKAWWQPLSRQSPDARTRQAVAEAVESLAGGGEVAAWLPGLSYVTGRAPAGQASSGQLAEYYREFLRRHGQETRAAWATGAITGRRFDEIPLRAWQRLARATGRSIDLQLVLLPEERAALVEAARRGVPPAPAAAAAAPPSLLAADAEANPAVSGLPSAVAAFHYGWYPVAEQGLGRVAASPHPPAIAHLLLGLSRLRQAVPDLAAAEEAFDAALGSPAATPGLVRAASRWRGRVLLAEERAAEALAALEAARLDEPGPVELDRPGGLADLAAVLTALGRHDDAAAALARAEALAPGAAEVAVSRARLLEARGDRAGALAVLDRLLEREAYDRPALELRGALRLAGGDRPGAESDLSAAALVQELDATLSRSPSTPDTDRLQALLAALTAERADQPDLYRWVGRVASARRDHATALSAFDCYLDAGGQDIFARLGRGLALEAMRREEDALRAFVQLGRQRPELQPTLATLRQRITARMLEGRGLSQP